MGDKSKNTVSKIANQVGYPPVQLFASDTFLAETDFTLTSTFNGH